MQSQPLKLNSSACDGAKTHTITSATFYSWGHGTAYLTQLLHLSFLHRFRIITGLIKVREGTWEPKPRPSQQVLMVQVYNETLLEPFSHSADVIHWTRAHAIYKVWDYQWGKAAGSWEDVEGCVWERKRSLMTVSRRFYLPRFHWGVLAVWADER